MTTYLFTFALLLLLLYYYCYIMMMILLSHLCSNPIMYGTLLQLQLFFPPFKYKCFEIWNYTPSKRLRSFKALKIYIFVQNVVLFLYILFFNNFSKLCFNFFTMLLNVLNYFDCKCFQMFFNVNFVKHI